MGNLSTGKTQRGVPRTLVRLPGVLVQATLCIPRAHPYAIWLLPWVEKLLSGASLPEIAAAPPWPVPADPLVVRHLQQSLFDLRWAVPDWQAGGLRVAPALREAFVAGGRAGLARLLFDAELVPGEWWAEAIGGTLLSRQTAAAFDWDRQKKEQVLLAGSPNPQALVDTAEPDLSDLLRKLGGLQGLWEARDRVFLGTPLRVTERRDILFPLFGEEQRLLPDELAELEPVLLTHHPELFGEKKRAPSRILSLPTSPVEGLVAELERLSVDPVRRGAPQLVQARLERVGQLLEAPELLPWLAETVDVLPVVGPTQRHFDALGEICAELPSGGRLLLASAFLNRQNVGEEDGLADALCRGPSDMQVLLLYGHANDDLPDQQRRDADQWLDVLERAAPELRGRVRVVLGKRRSHEKLLLSSTGDWMVGSWNPASSRPHATVFECSLRGRSPAFARQLWARVRENVEGEEAERWIASLGNRLSAMAWAGAEGAIVLLRRAWKVATQVDPDIGGGHVPAWTAAVRALWAALQPLRRRARLELVDEQQSRDMLLAQLRAARQDVLVASDRLAESGLDGATLRDLRGDGQRRRLVRVVWGREWGGGRPGAAAKEQIRRAQRTIREARELLGDRFFSSDVPMENHAKILLVDGLRGLVTSENLLSYGGEKGRYESRELGVVFWSPVLARHLQGRFLQQWPDLSGVGSGRTLAGLVAGNEVWHSLNTLGAELDFDWKAPGYLQAVVEAELPELHSKILIELQQKSRDFSWLREEGERLGLLQTGPGWSPYDLEMEPSAPKWVADAEAAQREDPRHRPVQPAVRSRHPLVGRVLEGMQRIAAGSFWMGDNRVEREAPRHRVTLSRPFLLAKVPVTQGLWKEVMGSLPHLRDIERHPEFPIVQVGYTEIKQFLDRLNALPGGGCFELPTEAQWEYACRAGSDSIYSFGDQPGSGNGPGPLEEYAWTKRNADGRLQRVGGRKPNSFGLYDMHGLVYETMRDGFRAYSRDAVIDPVGPLDGRQVVARGGCWGRFPVDSRRPENEHFRCASRQVHEKSHRVSFRLAARMEEK